MALEEVFVLPELLVQDFKYPVYDMYLPQLHFKQSLCNTWHCYFYITVRFLFISITTVQLCCFFGREEILEVLVI